MIPIPLPASTDVNRTRSEEHTSELQSQSNLVCRLLLEKKKKNTRRPVPLTSATACRPPNSPPSDRAAQTPALRVHHRSPRRTRSCPRSNRVLRPCPPS